MLKNAKKDLLFSIFLGMFGVQKFRKGQKELGLLFLFTLGVFLIGWLVDIIYYTIRLIRVRNSLYNFKTIEEIDYLEDGNEFEEYIASLLENIGYEYIEITNKSRDFGADIIINDADIKYALQCKYYSKPVGIEAVQQIYSAKKYYNCHIAIVVTNNIFTSPAIELAEATNVLLWDRLKLETMIKENIKFNY